MQIESKNYILLNSPYFAMTQVYTEFWTFQYKKNTFKSALGK